MKRILAAVLACSAVMAWGQPTAPKKPDKTQDAEFNKALKQMDDMLAKGYRTRPPEELTHQPVKRELGPIDTWRYESCQTDAAKAPTSQGVFAGMRVCREKFGQ